MAQTRDRVFLVTDHTGGTPQFHRIVSRQEHLICDSDGVPFELIQTGITSSGELVVLQEIQA